MIDDSKKLRSPKSSCTYEEISEKRCKKSMTTNYKKEKKIILVVLVLLGITVVLTALLVLMDSAKPFDYNGVQKTNLKIDVMEDGQTALHVKGETGFITMNLSGFENINPNYKLNSEQFFAKEKKLSHTRSIYITPSTYSIPDIDNAEKCRDKDWLSLEKHVKNNELIKMGIVFSPLKKEEKDGRIFIEYMNKKIEDKKYTLKTINYFTYHEDRCWVFHITTPLDEESLNQTDDLIQSIRYNPDPKKF